jgi:hypothetical protein
MQMWRKIETMFLFSYQESGIDAMIPASVVNLGVFDTTDEAKFVGGKRITAKISKIEVHDFWDPGTLRHTMRTSFVIN